jgi:hypothetical protein
MERELAVDMVNVTPTFAAALAVASSASLCTMPCTPTGAMTMGEGNLTPKRVVWRTWSALLVLASESGAYVKITMGSVAEHSRDDTPLLQCCEVIAIRVASPSIAKRIHVGI